MTVRRLVSSLVAALLGAATGVALAAPASAASGYCPRGTGVTVVVDRGSLGGGTSIGCDPAGANTSGSTVVPRAGFPLTYVARQPGFVCRVAGLPDASRESCGGTPPTNAYWGLFWSNGTSGTWTYASVGIGSLRVPAGGFIGWRFQDGGARTNPGTVPVSPRAASPTSRPSPSSSPTRRATKAPTPVRSPTASRTPGPTRSASPSATASKRAATAAPSAKPSPPKKPSTKKPSTPEPSPSAAPSRPAAADPSVTTSPSPSATGPDGDLAAGEQARKSSGPALPIVAGGLLAALAVAAGALAWRRRGA